jgi:uncharacterized phage protein (TIGR01671 family)
MKEIKFRVFGYEQNDMYDWDHIVESGALAEYLSLGGEGDNYHSPIMQYTGLKDKNDKEIYEGDIVICNDESEGRKRVVCYDIHQAKYKAVPKSTYYANAGNGGWTGFELRWYYEVIGNIYESPELFNA